MTLETVGWGGREQGLWSFSIEQLDAGDRALVPGGSLRVDRGECNVETAEGQLRASVPVEVTFPAGETATPATGDWVGVALATDDSLPTIVTVMDRRSTITRRDPADRLVEQTLVANIDHVLVVHALDQPVNRRRIERSLVLAWDSGAEPVVVLTKGDLAEDVRAAVAEVESVAAGVDVVVTTVIEGATGPVPVDTGVERLAAYAKPDGHGTARTLALIGASGAGKSTLVNALLGEDRQATGAVRAADGKGRHTTTSRELLVIPSGGVLLDTPGLRALGLWDAEVGVDLAFPDVLELAEKCRFRDCSHEVEPDCAVRAGIATGSLDARRLDSYLRLQAELDDIAVRQEDAARRTGEGSRPTPAPLPSTD